MADEEKPAFDPNQPFDVADTKPAFDPSKPWSDASLEAAVIPPDDHGLADRRKLSPVQKALNPITSYPETYSKMRKEGQETIGRGLNQLASPESAWDFAKGVGNTALGTLEYVGSPINAAYRSVIGQPVEDVTGIPREYTEFAAQLATPGLGVRPLSPKVPGAVLKPSEIQPSMAGRAAVPEAEGANELGIPLSRGQATRDLDAIRYEDMASRGAYGPKAQEEGAKFFDDQFKAIQAAGADVGETLGRTGPKVGDAGEASTVVNSELLSTAEKARAVVAEAERRAAAEAVAHEASVANTGRTLDETVRSGRAPVQNVREAGEAVGQGVRDAADTASNEYKGLYKEAFDLPGEFGVGSFTDIGNSIKHSLTNSESPVIIDDTTKVASRALDDLNKIQNLKFENRAAPKGNGLAPVGDDSEIVAVNLKGVDQARKLLVARYQQAKAQARATQDFSDQRAMERIIDAFDDHIEQSISNGLFSGDPRALSALQEARASFSSYRKTYRPNPGDDVSTALNRIVTRNATPEEISNMIVGSGKLGNAGLPVRLAERLKTIFGDGSDQWSTIRQAIWQKASNVRNAAGELDAAKSASTLNDFTGTTLARTVFTPAELSAMRSHASGIRSLDSVIENLPSAHRSEQAKSAYQHAFGGADIGGSQATVFRRIMDGTATPQETTQVILGAVNSTSSGNVVRAIKAIEKIVGPESDTMNAIRQGVWQKLTKNAAGKDQPGQQKVAQAINEFLNGQGRMVAKQLYSPDELALMKKYADAIKLTVIPPRAATRSDTAVGLMAALHKYSGAIASAIGGVFGHGPVGALTGYGVGKLLEKGTNSIKDMKELNRIRGQFEPPSAAKILPARGRAISLPPAVGPALANPPKYPFLQSPSSAGAGEDQNNIPRPPAQQHNGGQVDGYADGGAVHTAIDNSHDVKSGAVASKNPNGPVYIDRRIPKFSPVLKDRNGRPALLWKYLTVHETEERKAMAGGMPYEEAHETKATPAERAAVQADGVDWGKYTHEMDGYLDHIEHEGVKNPPPNPHVDPNMAVNGHTHHHSGSKAKRRAEGGAVSDWDQGVDDARRFAATDTPDVLPDDPRAALLAASMGRAGDTLKKNAPLLMDTGPGRISQALGRVASGNTPYAGPGLRREDYTDDPSAPQPVEPMLNDAMNVADVMSMGAMPMAAKGAAGIFGGKLAVTADHQALNMAERLAKAGASREQIWNETGWFQGPDKKWRFEIPDKGASVSPGKGGYWDAHVDHPEFFKAYPRTAGYEANINYGEPRGSYWGGGMEVVAPTREQMGSIAVHEMQHAAQASEGFPKGTSPDALYMDAKLPKFELATKEAQSRGIDWASLSKADRKRLTDQVLDDLYYRNAGEVEARNVQRRMNMTPEERHAQPPWTTEDVPADQQIIPHRADGGDIGDDPFERAAYRVRQAARPEGGRQEGPLSEALSDPAFLFNASPLGPVRDTLHAVNEGEYGRAAASAAPLLAPMAGPAIRGASALVRAAPRTAATLAGIAGIGIPSATDIATAEAEPKADDWWRTPREPFNHPEFVPPTLTAEEREPFTQPGFVAPDQSPRPNLDGLGPMARKETQARYDQRLEKAAVSAEEARKAHAARQAKLDEVAAALLDRKTSKAREDWEKARDDAIAAHAEEQARLDQRDLEFKRANQSFTEAHPSASLALPAAGAAIAGAIPYGGRMMARGANNAVARQLEEAASRARLALGSDAATRAAARGEMKAGLGPAGVGRITDEHSTGRSNAAAMISGGLGSAEASLIPYEVDRLLPEGSHGRHESDDPKNWLQRGAFGSLGGILGSRYGMEAPLLRGRVTPPVSEMEGLLAGLKTAKTAPPRVKVEPKPRSRRKKSDDDNVVPLRESGNAAGGRILARAHGGRVDASNINHDPTEAEKRVGNYAKDFVNVHGLELTIENAKGSTRSGIGADGKSWKSTLPMHYGYVRRKQMGADGQHVDIYLGPHTKSPRVYVIDQIDPHTGRFDEHKAIIGLGSEKQARAFYARAFSDGKGHARIGRIHEMAMERFKSWLNDGDTTKPFAHTIPEAEKREHASVGYVAVSRRKGEHCSNCMHYIPGAPPACEGVRKPIAPVGWCRRYKHGGGLNRP